PGAAEVGGHEGPLSGRPTPPGLADVLRQADRLAAAEVHDELAVAVDPGAGPGDRAGKADAGEGPPRHGEIAGRLTEALDALQAGNVVVEGIGAAAPRVEQDPEPAPLILGAPADVMEHHGPG